MNRALRRQIHALETKLGAKLVAEGELESFVVMQRFFLAAVKSQGRVRIAQDVLDGLVEGDRVTMKRVDGGVLLSFTPAGSQPEEGSQG